MVSLVMLAIMAGCAVYLYLKGTLVQGIIMILNALIAGLIAFGFYEMLAAFVVNYSPGIAAWSQMMCFLLLFVLVFAGFQAAVMQLCKEKVDMGVLAERVGRPLSGVILGYLITGYLLVALGLAPLPSQYPYSRFDERNPNLASPSQPMLSPDGLVTGLFSTISKGSFSALGEPRSFAMLHAGFLDQIHLNRLKATADVAVFTKNTPAVDVSRKDGIWFAPDNLRDSEGRPLSSRPGENLVLVRADIKKSGLRDETKFTLSQLRLVCGPKGSPDSPLAGAGQAAYPIGYIGAESRLENKPLSETIDASKAKGDDLTMTLAFYVPTNMTPVLLQFKRNNIVQLARPASAEDAPEPVPFTGPAS